MVLWLPGFMVAYWWVLILEALAAALVIGLLALAAPKLVRSNPRSLTQLRVSMAVTAVAIFLGGVGLILGVSELIARYYGSPGLAGGMALGVAAFVAIIMVLQWLFAPHIINAIYRTRPPETPYELQLQVELERLARASGVKTPKLRIAETMVPNAFAYGSPLTGNYVAVTKGLLRSAPREEVIAVLGHEVGHLKHRDVAWILALSLIPLAIYFLGRMLIWSAFFSGTGRRDRESGGPLLLLAIGALLVVAGILFRFLVAHFNRLREYYADAHSALTTGNPRWLQRALARIHVTVKNDPRVRAEIAQASTISQLFIVAPLVELFGGFAYDIDYVVEQLKRSETSAFEELVSSHPPIPKRLRFLDEIEERLGIEVPLK